MKIEISKKQIPIFLAIVALAWIVSCEIRIYLMQEKQVEMSHERRLAAEMINYHEYRIDSLNERFNFKVNRLKSVIVDHEGRLSEEEKPWLQRLFE